MPEEPTDPRFTLANERTFLAYVRTALALVAGGVAVDQLGPRVDSAALRYLSAGLLLALGLGSVVGGYLRWRNVDVAMRRGEPVGVTKMPGLLTLGLLVVVVAASVLIAVG